MRDIIADAIRCAEHPTGGVYQLQLFLADQSAITVSTKISRLYEGKVGDFCYELRDSEGEPVFVNPAHVVQVKIIWP